MNVLDHRGYIRDSVNPHIPDATVQFQGDHRFRGYPNAMMESPRIPVANPVKRNVQPGLVPATEPAHYPSRSPQPTNPPQPVSMPPPPPLFPAPPDPQQSEMFSPMQKHPSPMNFSKTGRSAGFSQSEIDDILNKRYEMNKLKSYDPWGKPGHGAPNPKEGKHHKRKFTEEDLKEDLKPGAIGGMNFHTPGGGAPLRSSSGRIRTEISGCEDIRHRTVNRGRDYVETFRYKKDPNTTEQYRSELDKIQRERAAAQEQQRYSDLKADLASIQYEAYGKPGAGAPNVVSNYGSMNASRRYRDVFRDVPKQTTLGMGVTRGYGAPLSNDHGEMKTKLPTTLDKKDGGITVRDDVPGAMKSPFEMNENIFHPFGSPGGGNPNYDRNGNRIAIIQGRSTVMRDVEEEKRKALAAQEYKRELQRGMMEHELMKKREMQNVRSPTEALADKMYTGQGGKPRRDPNTGQLVAQHLRSTDITNLSNISPRHDHSYTQQQTSGSQTYYTDLERQSEARKLRNILEKNRDQMEARNHHENFYRNFGHSAPGENLKKQKLLQNLYHPDMGRNEYKKPVNFNVPILNTKYVKNNTNSYHGTAYEMGNQSSGDNYSLRSPYAPHDN